MVSRSVSMNRMEELTPVLPFAPGGLPPDPKTERLDRTRSLPERADELERHLGLALKSYRERAEEVLDQHFEGMEKAQLMHDYEVSMLKAENAKLRELVGRADDPNFLQQVLFQASSSAPEAATQKKDAKNKMKKGAEDDDNVTLASRRGKKGAAEVEQQPGGTWQNFVAWVPNGAALLNAEPWKPLNQQGASGQSSPAHSSSLVSMHAPPAVAGVKGKLAPLGLISSISNNCTEERRKSNGDDEDTSDSEHSSHLAREDQLQLLPVWHPTDRERSLRRGSHYSGENDDNNSSLPYESAESEQYDMGRQTMKSKWVINPDSRLRISWDLSSLCMVVYDMIIIPMSMFTLPDDPFLLVMDWTTRCFWTVDMGWSCCTGVVLEDGSVEYRVRQILQRYLKSWLGLDFFIVGSDWAGVVLSSGGMGLTKLARVSRVARVVRLLRLVRMQEVIASITERIQSDKMILLLHILKVFVLLIACCHVTACGWWGVGNITSGASWIKQYGYTTQDLGAQYLVSLHWSLSQFSGGLEELAPTGTLERFYTVLIWLVSFISGLVMLSFLTSSLTQQYIIGGSGARQMATLRKYLGQNKVPKPLIKRLCRSAKHALSGDLQPESVDLLHVVSEPLKIEMHYEMFSRVLSHHPFFADFLREGNQLMRRVCHLCMSMLLLDNGDVLFVLGDEPSEGKMYFVFSGTFEYTDKWNEVRAVTEKQWVSEPALWANWKHQGTLEATSDAKMAVIESEPFQEVCSQYMKKNARNDATFSPKAYAAHFIDEMNALTEWSDLYTDLGVLAHSHSALSNK